MTQRVSGLEYKLGLNLHVCVEVCDREMQSECQCLL